MRFSAFSEKIYKIVKLQKYPTKCFYSLSGGTTRSFGHCYLNFQLFFIVAQSQLTGIYNFGSVYTIVPTREYFTVFYRDIMGKFIQLGNYMHDSVRKWCLRVWAWEIYEMRVSHAKGMRVERSVTIYGLKTCSRRSPEWKLSKCLRGSIPQCGDLKVVDN